MSSSKEFPPMAKPALGSLTGDDAEKQCDFIHGAVHDYVSKNCASTFNEMEHEHGEGCPCSGGSGSNPKVDLIILIDSSGSMNTAAKAVAAAAESAIKTARKECGVDDLRVNWFTVDNSNSGSGSVPPSFSPTFTDTHQAYLSGIGAPGPFQHDDPDGEPNEEGADAINDLARFYDWREGACRAVFYVSDTTLDGDSSSPAVQQAAVALAIAACQANDVTVFAHFTHTNTSSSPTLTAIEQTYTDLTSQTGGAVHLGDKPSKAIYERLLKQAICEACGTCKSVQWPDIQPCISISWGDSDCDCMESDDHEKLCITICNCYDNVTFSGVKVAYLWLTDENGKPPPSLPDGSPASRIYPLGPICFGDIGPCTEEGPTCVSQEAIIINRGVKPGKYQLHVGGLCYGISRHYYTERETFTFEICAS